MSGAVAGAAPNAWQAALTAAQLASLAFFMLAPRGPWRRWRVWAIGAMRLCLYHEPFHKQSGVRRCCCRWLALPCALHLPPCEQALPSIRPQHRLHASINVCRRGWTKCWNIQRPLGRSAEW